MSAFHDDDAIERELFALRARALPGPRLDVGDVFARAERAKAPRLRALRGRFGLDARTATWIGAAACAAASLCVVLRSGDASHLGQPVAQAPTLVASAPQSRGEIGDLTCGGGSGGLASRSTDEPATAEGGGVVHATEPLASLPLDSPDGLVCDQAVTFSSAGP